MNALLFAALLLLPAASSGPRGPGSIVQEQALPACSPPLLGDWWVGADCLLTGDHTVTGSVYVVVGSSLVLAPNASLDLDFSLRHLWIGVGSRVVVGVGARVH